MLYQLPSQMCHERTAGHKMTHFQKSAYVNHDNAKTHHERHGRGFAMGLLKVWGLNK